MYTNFECNTVLNSVGHYVEVLREIVCLLS